MFGDTQSEDAVCVSFKPSRHDSLRFPPDTVKADLSFATARRKISIVFIALAFMQLELHQRPVAAALLRHRVVAPP